VLNGLVARSSGDVAIGGSALLVKPLFTLANRVGAVFVGLGAFAVWESSSASASVEDWALAAGNLERVGSSFFELGDC